MTDLLWDDVAWLLDPTDGGCLPDVYTADTTVADWQAALHLVVERGWGYAYTEGDTARPLPRAETVLARPADPECPHLPLRPSPDLCALAPLPCHEHTDLDVSHWALHGQERPDVLC
ncbi:hypothetical protein VM98_35005, partial [Streptomyces rubellomurinus subsp. indigoferus]